MRKKPNAKKGDKKETAKEGVAAEESVTHQNTGTASTISGTDTVTATAADTSTPTPTTTAKTDVESGPRVSYPDFSYAVKHIAKPTLSPAEVVAIGRQLLADAGEDVSTAQSNFVNFSVAVCEVIRHRPDKDKYKEFLIALYRLRDDFDKEVLIDRMILYQPAHAVALEFHMSKAKVRYNCSANRTSKTQSGYAEHYFVTTGRNPYRQYTPPPAATFIIGVDFSKYGPNVFQKKLITGEPGNILAPMFPEGGRWFNHYDERTHCLTLACRDCALTNKGGSCRHARSTISLFSDNEGPDVLQGGAYALGHFDEHIHEEFFTEAMERLKTIRNSSMIVTGTPRLGKSSWEYRILVSTFQKGPVHNVVSKRNKTPYVSIHSIGQEAAGIVPKDEIEASKLTMDPIEQMARLEGKMAPLAKHSVFDRWALHEMEQRIEAPMRYTIAVDGVEVLSQKHDGPLRVWDEPRPKGSYIIGMDVSAGLVDRDYSCASVIDTSSWKMVAQYHAWVEPLRYGDICYRLGKFYNNALLVPERTGGLGVATIGRLKELGYPNLFRDLSDTAQASFAQGALFGVDTNVRSKAQMVGCLQTAISDRSLDIRCAETLEELRSFGQEVTKTGLTFRFRGEGGAADDRVMSLAFPVYIMLTYPHLVGIEVKVVTTKVETEVKKYLDPMWTQLYRELKEDQQWSADEWV